MEDLLNNYLKNKNFSATISKNPALLAWILEKTDFLPEKSTISERVWNILNDSSQRLCPNGNKFKFDSFATGYLKSCGRPTKCMCAKLNHSTKISQAKKAMTPEQLNKANQKRKETTKNKYGVEFNSQIEHVRAQKKQKYEEKTKNEIDAEHQKKRETCMQRYGVEHPQQNREIRTKTVETLKSTYGEHYTPFMRRNEFIKTMKDRHGVENALQSSDIRQKMRQTCLDRFGVEYASQSEEVKNKNRLTCWSRYNAPHFKRREYSEEANLFLENMEQIKLDFSNMGFNGIREKYDLPNAVIYSALERAGIEFEKHLYSTEQLVLDMLLEFIDRDEIKLRDRTEIKPLELDFFLPKYGIAIETCGLYWHADFGNPKARTQHAKKQKLCQEKGIRLITIFEDELNEKSKIVKNRLRHILGFDERICGARQTRIEEISSIESRDFLEKNHIQGNVNAKIRFGAFYANELVAVMTFGNKRKALGSIAEHGNFELLRFASKSNIPGIASRLFSKFRKEYNPISVISYCDLRWGTGEVYKKLGFRFIHRTEPNYWYLSAFHSKRENRFKYRKDRLIEAGFDDNKSEWEIMQERGYSRIWDCGSLKFIWEPESHLMISTKIQ